jgi:hydrogenase maturation protease
MQSNSPRILIYGYGNPGRQDDALGVMLSEKIDSWAKSENLPGIDTDQNYQLNIEDADKISQYDLVVFADASVNDIESFQMDRVLPDMKSDFSMHSVSPSFVTGLCNEAFKKRPEVYQLEIKGYKWEFMEKITENARKNLSSAEKFLRDFILKNMNRKT